MPIINPFYFYLIDLCGTLKDIGIIVGFIFLILGLIFAIFSWADKTKNPFSKILIILGTISLLIGVVIPSKKTAEKMLVAKYVTYENYENGNQEVKEIVDYIFEKIEKDKESDN